MVKYRYMGLLERDQPEVLMALDTLLKRKRIPKRRRYAKGSRRQR